MIIRGWKFLDSVKIKKIVRTLADELEMDKKVLPFLARTPIVQADEDEIIGKFKARTFAADLVADGQEAVTHSSGSFEFTSNTIPNIKHGEVVNQSMINRLERLKRNLGDQQDIAYLTDWQRQAGLRLVNGLRERVNYLICGMQMDSAAYNRLGINLTGATWGMPSDLKVTSSNGWDDATNGTPISDIQIVVTETAPDNYGEVYNRATLGSKAFRYATQTAEFRNRISGDLRFAFTAAQLNYRDTEAMRQAFSNLTNTVIEIYDGTIVEEENTGKVHRKRVLPTNKVILSNTGDDNNAAQMDFANGIVTESIAGTITDMPGFNGAEFGPIVFMTSSADLNPPDVKIWSVMRGFPRKHRSEATAVLTVGSGSNWA
jgi:hypothetical protein